MPTAPQQACRICRALGCQDPAHKDRRDKDAWRRQRAKRPYSSSERRRHELAIKAWVEEHGWLCPGAPELGHAPHHVDPGELDVDHVVPVARGGAGGPERILCRSVNRGRR